SCRQPYQSDEDSAVTCVLLAKRILCRGMTCDASFNVTLTTGSICSAHAPIVMDRLSASCCHSKSFDVPSSTICDTSFNQPFKWISPLSGISSIIKYKAPSKYLISPQE